MICFPCNLEADDVFIEEDDNVCSNCGYHFMKKSKIPTEHNHEIGYASNYHLQNLTWAEHISIRPGQEICSGSMYLNVSGQICTTYKYPYQYKEESPCLYDGTRYSGSHSDAVQHYIMRCRGTAVPCPYGRTSRKREPLYVGTNKK